MDQCLGDEDHDVHNNGCAKWHESMVGVLKKGGRAANAPEPGQPHEMYSLERPPALLHDFLHADVCVYV